MKKWFKAKKYGYGWKPASPEGWIVIIIFVSAIFGITYFFKEDPIVAVILSLICTFFAFIISIKKGDPLKWRWGEEKE